MRRTLIFALLLVAASAASAAGSQAPLAKAHRKASAAARAVSRPAKPHTASRTAAKHAVQSTGTRKASRATAKAIHYTPVRAHGRTVGLAGGSSSYAAGFSNGYAAGRADALRQMESDGRNAKPAGRPAEPLPPRENAVARQPAASATAEQPAADRDPDEPVAARAVNRSTKDQPAADGTLEAPASADTPKTSTQTETALLNPGRAGIPSPLRGSMASLARQNARTDAEGLERILDEDDLSSRIAHGLLVPLPASTALTVNPNLVENHRYCRPWTAQFLADLARAHEAAFHRPIEVNSAVRTAVYQKRLRSTNGNAAAAEGDIVSPHLTGATVDIAKEELSRQEMGWMRHQLKGLQDAGKIDVEEEFEQACFHITVYKSYTPARPPHKTGQPETSQGAATGHKAGQPAAATPAPAIPAAPPAAVHPARHLPGDMAAGELPVHGR